MASREEPPDPQSAVPPRAQWQTAVAPLVVELDGQNLVQSRIKDIAVLQSMGAGHRQVRGIFLLEGMLISLIGALLGLALGALLCWLQMRFGIIRLGGSDSSFVVNTYPVFMQAGDFLLVFSTVMLIGLLAAAYPVLHIRRAHIGEVRLD